MRFGGGTFLVVFLTLLFLALSLSSNAVQPENLIPKVRALWVVRYSLSSPEQVQRVVQLAHDSDFNTLFVQVRGRGDAWYESKLEPRAEALADQPASFDPLATIIQEAHQVGIKVIAWVNAYLVWTGERLPKAKNHIMNAHPDWISHDKWGHFSMVNDGRVEGAYLQPSNPAVQNHLYKVYLDIAKRYDIDGIHFDFIRYPNSDYDFSDSTLLRFKKYMDKRITASGREAVEKDGGKLAYVHTFPDQWEKWRAQQVTNLVKRISEGIRRIKPNIEISAAVFPDPKTAAVDKGQDWSDWMKKGYLDAVCPMAYSQNTDLVLKQIKEDIQAAYGHKVYAGLGSWRLSPEDTVDKIRKVMDLGVNGICLFSYDDLTQNGKTNSYLAYIDKHCFTHASTQSASMDQPVEPPHPVR